MKHKDACSKLHMDDATKSTAASSGGSSGATPKKKQAWSQALASVQEDISAMTQDDEMEMEDEE